MITQKRLLEELLALNRHYPFKKSNDDIEIISSDYFEDLSYMAEVDFIKSIKIWRRKGKQFPLISDLIECHNEIIVDRRNKQQELKLISVSEEKRIENIKRLAELKNRLAGKKGI